ncbi:MAG: hypothetical protein KTR30_14550 [Saprospiraceae bacterium]|nr:hypothetical protein [Saprospiraceae bacterium]
MSRRLVVGLVALSLMGLVLVQYQLLRTGLLLEKGKIDQGMRAALADVNIAINRSFETQLMLQRLSEQRERELASPELLIPHRLEDSLQLFVDQALSRRGILLEYELGLLAPFLKDTLLVTTEFHKENDRYEEFRRRLNGQLTSTCQCQPELHLHVDHLFNYLLGRLAILIIPSILFLLLLVFCLAWLIRNLNRQKRLDEVKNDFINNLTHELKTPVFSSSLLLKMLRQRLQNQQPKVQEYLNLMEKENEQMKGHIEKVLELASLENGKYELDQQLQNVHSLVEQLTERYHFKLEEQGGRLLLDLQAEESHARVDQVHLQNALQNIIENAIKYNPAPLQLRIRSYNTDTHLHLELADDGIGIALEHQKKIFEKFYRVPTGNLHNVKGFGLGLSYVKHIIEAHGGQLALQSIPGQGSTFSILLPFERKERLEKETINA